MQGNFTKLTYRQTGYFSSLITDYLDAAPALRPFYKHPVSIEGMKAAIDARKEFPTDRTRLVKHLQQQYEGLPSSEIVNQKIASLSKNSTFTICTAHQPALFTGTLYFVYKILHAVRLAETLKQEFPSYDFVPVYWMGSEDADLDELGKFYLSNEKIVWNTKQKGAVGKMSTKGLDSLINRIEGELSVLPFGKELVSILKDAYLNSTNIQTATFKLLHGLFSRYGLVVIIPDTAILKELMSDVFKEDLLQHTPSSIVSKTTTELEKNYKVQAHPREINLFYFKDNLRNRIEKKGEQFIVTDTDIVFSTEEILLELKNHPERFSPNVILRGLFQETVLPNIAFVGGGGETAYWLELKELFTHYKVPYPVLVLRNSFLLVPDKWQDKIRKSGFGVLDYFQSETTLINTLVKRNKNGQLQLTNEIASAIQLYEGMKNKAVAIDATLEKHVDALKTKTLKPLEELEKKMLRAEKRKYTEEQNTIHQIKSALFPLNGLQERIENFMPYYSRMGTEFFDLIYKNSLGLEQEFGVIEVI